MESVLSVMRQVSVYDRVIDKTARNLSHVLSRVVSLTSPTLVIFVSVLSLVKLEQ